MSRFRISIVQYLNTAPLVWGFTDGPLRGKYELSFTVPSLCAEALRNGQADIAIIPAIEYQRIADLVIIPDIAIASKNRVRSLLIVSKEPIENAKTIALDSSSRSTQTLTRILCHLRWKIAPEFFEMPPDIHAMLQCADAALLIGDPALRLSLGSKDDLQPDGSLHVYDVVEEWRKMTNLPAVLAVWAGRPEVVSEEVIEDFQNSRDLGLENVSEISQRAAQELRLPAGELERYLTENIDFSLDEGNLNGLTAYFAQAAALRLIPSVNPLTIAKSKPASYTESVFAKRS